MGYSFFTDTSALYPINNRQKDFCIISNELSGFIELALFYAQQTQNAFDIAAAGTLKILSSSASLDEYRTNRDVLLPFASSKCIDLNNNRLSFSNPYTKIDLGGLIKEYAVDEAMFLIKQAGLSSALVNFGGDITVCGKYNENRWCIGIQNPHNMTENISQINLENSSLCTSGHSKRFHMIEEEKISHIVTQKPNNYAQITISAPTTVDAGIWSTALLVNPGLVTPAHISIKSVIYNI